MEDEAGTLATENSMRSIFALVAVALLATPALADKPARTNLTSDVHHLVSGAVHAQPLSPGLGGQKLALAARASHPHP
jgi:hypothetical protein